jgi:hypothetical protein
LVAVPLFLWSKLREVPKILAAVFPCVLLPLYLCGLLSRLQWLGGGAEVLLYPPPVLDVLTRGMKAAYYLAGMTLM